MCYVDFPLGSLVAMTRKASVRLDQAAWIKAGLQTLATHGIDAVLVEKLAKKLKVTKGSFYWHFRNRDELLRHMLNAWRQRATLLVIDRLEQSGKGTDSLLHQLLELPVAGPRASEGASLELAIRLWAKRDRRAAAAIDEVDRHRIDYISSLLKRRGMARRKAAARAFLIYSYMLGESFVSFDRSDSEIRSAEAFLLRV